MKYLLLYNPISGKGKFKNHIPFITKWFFERNLKLDIYESCGSDDLYLTALNNANTYDVFLVSGGDGTVNKVVNGIMHANANTALAILPYGTANDIAHILGINKNIKKTLDLITKSEPILMDVNKINEDYFIYTVATGILTKISYDVSRRRIKKYGYLAYVFEGGKDLLLDYRLPLSIKTDDSEVKGEYMLALGLAANRVGGLHLSHFGNSKINDGLLAMRLFERKRRFRIFRLVAFFLRKGKKLKEDVHLVSSYYEIKTIDKTTWNIDGEKSYCGSVTIKTIKERLRVFASDKSKQKYF